MKKLTILIVVLSLAFSSTAKPKWIYVNFKSEKTNEDFGLYLAKITKIESGKYRFEQFTKDTVLMMSTFCQNRKGNGIQGLFTEYHSNGKVKAKGEHRGRGLIGKYNKWYDSGNPQIEGFYNINGEKDGEWKWYFDNGQLRKTGSYKEGKKSGVFTEYNEDGQITFLRTYNDHGLYHGTYKHMYNGELYDEGQYNAGKKDGVWNHYYKSGSISCREIYENGFLKGISYWDSLGMQISDTTGLNSGFQIKGGTDQWYKDLQKHVKYPNEAFVYEIQGKVVISFTVNDKGEVFDYKVEKSVHPILDEEALRVIKLMSNKWTSGLSYNRPGKMRFSLPVNFFLQ